MTARILDGKATALAVRETVAARVARLVEAGVQPGLTVVLVGEDPASQVYVRNKDRAATQAGFDVHTVRLPASTSQTDLIAEVERLNADESVHGILVQLPLPAGLDADAVVRALDPRKDVDGLHPENVAALVMGTQGLVPCTPAGCIEILDRHGIELEGRHVVVVGRSMLVGKPLAQLALARNATVTICHSRTRDLAGICRQADVLIAAVGRAELVKGDWVREGATVLDVGINRGADGKLVGDVEFEAAMQRAGAITPVPGGIGPMTIAMLLSNTATAAARLGGVPESAEEAAVRR
ncbi:MAG: bifunctional methylenetetrahydrofolate dehydrogenase/methenyltetrahydrofolate cyclohydrolase FolD [Planctomycetes bacterium]|nr:bifunctional methylenetetrahydrofolate dehydrogenase/methenyltetrahydrofolate cyclohydrolase FolD [Planctomycetota bacterium]MCB9905232.1 bifunctional methylenetetrahydrofolate dehydrogenase/methenyltetrahydrofolate cyclohydrolase FolD [Planctomycetota bacterium]